MPAPRFITNLAPTFVRTSFSMWHAGYAIGIASVTQLHAKTAIVVYSDFPPGKDSLEAFRAAFESQGGRVIDAIPAGGPAPCRTSRRSSSAPRTRIRT